MNLNIFKRIADLEETIAHLYELHDVTITKDNSLSDELSQLQPAKQKEADMIAKLEAAGHTDAAELLKQK